MEISQQRIVIFKVGAGTIDIDQLDIQKLNADCGAGEIDMVVTGKREGL